MMKQIIQVVLHGILVSDSAEFKLRDKASLDEIASEVEKRFGDHAFCFRRFGKNAIGRRYAKDRGYVYMRGKVQTRDEILAGTDPRDDVLRTNVRFNDFQAVIRIGGAAMPFRPGIDKVLEASK